MRPLKIGFVLDDSLDSTDGVQQYVLTLGEWLGSQGHEVHYLVGETKRTDISYVHSLSQNLKVMFNGNRLSIPLPTRKRQLAKLLAEEKFDVLHVQMPYSPLLAGRIITLAPKKTAVVGTFHILPHSRFVSVCSRLLALVEHRTLKRFNVVFAVSAAAQTFASKSFKVAAAVLPNVIDVNRFATAEALPQLKNPQALTVLFLGRLVPRKGCRTLLEAVALLQKQSVQNFKVVICGKGPLETELKQFVEKNGLSDMVEFVGFVSEADKPRYYKSADIAVFPSTGGESFGIVLAEAMAAGAVTVAAANPGYASVLENNSDVLFKPGDSQALAQKIERYLQDKNARTQVKAWQQKSVQAFDTAAVGRKLLEAYGKIIAATARGVHNRG